MGWPKGKPKDPRSGRKPGTPNKVQAGFKAAVVRLLDGANLDELFEDVPPHKRLEVLGKLGEYAFPRLARTELTGADGEKLTVNVSINWNVKTDK